ncbi:MAG: sialidase family protein [Planctomycetota bacterium]
MNTPPGGIPGRALAAAILIAGGTTVAIAGERVYDFDGSMSRAVLDSYLSRAVTHAGLCGSSSDPTTATLDDDIRMLKHIGAKFVGRAAFAWHLPRDEEAHFAQVKAAAECVHEADREIILQACVFEIVSTDVGRIRVPAWAFEGLGLPVEQRNFDYRAMLYPDGRRHDHWRKGSSVPDMSRRETRLWFYYRARRYIDCGIEAIHFGQVMIMDDNDPGHRHWLDMLGRVRAYAKRKARRRFVLCDAHTHGEVEDGRLLFDFHSFPMRIREAKGKPQVAYLTAEGAGDIFGRSKGGFAPSGWRCESAPYLVEFDNYGYSGRGGESVGGIWVWGYDEISWFAHQPEGYRNRWLRYAHGWVKEHAPGGHLQMPTRRILAAPVDGNVWMFQGNTRSEACPNGFSVEDTIRDIWAAEDRGEGVAVENVVRRDVYVSGEGGYKTYRIPALAVTAGGTVLAFCEGRKRGPSDEGDIDLLLKRSGDGGRSWSETIVVHEEGKGAPITIGNPCPVVERGGERGGDRIHLLFTRNNKRLFYTGSTDDGASWSTPRELSHILKGFDYPMVRIATGPVHGMQMRSGRLIVPVWVSDRERRNKNRNSTKSRFQSGVIYSDDGGDSWRTGGLVAPVLNRLNECTIIERTDGTLLMNARAHGAGSRALATSADGGETWSKPVLDKALPCPTCQASMVRLDAREVLFLNPASRNRRRNLTLRLSPDDGRTWSHSRVVNAGRAGYSDVAVTRQGTILCLFENGERDYRERISVVEVTRDWLTVGAGGGADGR